MGTPGTKQTSNDSAMPLRLGETHQFARVRNLLRSAAFHEPAICQRLKLTQFDRILGLTREKAVLSETPDCLDVLIRLFLLRESLSLEFIRPLIPAETL